MTERVQRSADRGARSTEPADAAEAIISDLESAVHPELNTRSEYAARLAILLNMALELRRYLPENIRRDLPTFDGDPSSGNVREFQNFLEAFHSNDAVVAAMVGVKFTGTKKIKRRRDFKTVLTFLLEKIREYKPAGTPAATISRPGSATPRSRSGSLGGIELFPPGGIPMGAPVEERKDL
jgi:hypothetical protein